MNQTLEYVNKNSGPAIVNKNSETHFSGSFLASNRVRGTQFYFYSVMKICNRIFYFSEFQNSLPILHSASLKIILQVILQPKYLPK